MMALRDYYRCKKCGGKVVYGPGRREIDKQQFTEAAGMAGITLALLSIAARKERP
jgi:hypothetical protein